VSNIGYLLIIFTLLAIIPAGVVYVVLWMRQIAAEKRIGEALGGRDDIARLQVQFRDLNEKVLSGEAKTASLDESLKYFNNKIAARDRWQQRKEKKDEDDDDPTPVTVPGVEQQQIQFPQYPQMPPAAAAPSNGGRPKFVVKQF